MRFNSRSVFLGLFATAAALAQTTSQKINGTVKDPSGGVVPAAKITIHQTETNLAREATAAESGYFVIANIPIGDYELQAEAPGFQKYVQRGLKIAINDKITVDVGMKIGSRSESVTVQADALMVESQRRGWPRGQRRTGQTTSVEWKSLHPAPAVDSGCFDQHLGQFRSGVGLRSRRHE